MALSPPRKAATGPWGSAAARRATSSGMRYMSRPSTGQSPRSATATLDRSVPVSPSKVENRPRAARISPGARHASDGESEAADVGTPTTTRSGSGELEASQSLAVGQCGSEIMPLRLPLTVYRLPSAVSC